MPSRRIQLSRRHLLATAMAGATGFAAPRIVCAQGAGSGPPLKVGVLLPRSGYEASIGQDCQRGVDIAPGILK
jgi:branched-chain amino acid transport system substrate-binding protein